MNAKDNRELNVLCIGSLGKDVFLPVGRDVQVDHVESALCFGRGAKVHIEDRYEAIGGGACNVAVALSRLGVQTAVYGVIGEDGDGQWIEDVLTREGVNTSLVVRRPEKTDLSCIITDQFSGERTILVNRDVGENMVFDADHLPRTPWIYFTSFYGDDATVAQNMQLAHDYAVASGARIAYNPGMTNIVHHSQHVCDLVHHAQCVFVNRQEAHKIVFAWDPQYNEGDTDEAQEVVRLVRALQKITAAPDAAIVVTDGTRGAWASTGQSIVHISATTQKAVDTTGAGDTFASGFLAGYMRGNDLETCVRWGACNSRSVIMHYGAQAGALTTDEVVGCVDENAFEVAHI